MTADFASETMEVIRNEHNVFQVLKENNSQSRILYPMKIFFRKEGDIKTFSDIRKCVASNLP